MKYQKSVDAIANHTQKEYKRGPEIAKTIKELRLRMISIPDYPTAKAGATVVDPGDLFLWQQDVQESKKRISLFPENKKRAYALFLRQCSSEFDSKIKGSDAYVQANADQDVVQLLVIIRGYCCQFEDHQ